jgi:hypothetical protein
MTKYNKFQRPEFTRPPIHPVWRGIGLILALLIPVLSYMIAVELVRVGMEQGWPFVVPLGGRLQLPADMYVLPGIAEIAYFLSNQPDMGAVLTYFVLIMITFFGMLSLGYALLYRLVGPPQYLPIDEPPPKASAKRYKR